MRDLISVEDVMNSRASADPLKVLDCSLVSDGGAAVVIDFFAAHPEAVASTVLVDPQGFIDGAPPVSVW